MHLTKEEEKILAGEYGFAKQKAMQILVALGKTYDADKLIPIKNAHLSGISYKGLGDAGLEFLQDLSRSERVAKSKISPELSKDNAKVVVPTTLNPGGVSAKMNPPKEFSEKQKKIIDAYKKLGCDAVLTCTPYYFAKVGKADHIAWAESSAVIYANSVLGAYTNREGGPSALAAALIGKTPNYGMHLEENRVPKITISVKDNLEGFDEFAALGYYVGKNFREEIVNFNFKTKPSDENLKGLCAALATSGKFSMFTIGRKTAETIEVGKKDLKAVYETFNSKLKPDLVCIGCPHASAAELKKIASLLKGKKISKNIAFWVFTSEFVRNEISKLGLENEIENSGAKIIIDTCMVVAPLEDLGFKCMLTNSAKAAFYAQNLCNVETKLSSLEEIVKNSVQ